MKNGIIRTSAMREKKEDTARVRYSAAYPTGRKLLLEPRYGCAEEALLRRVASPYGESEGPSRGRTRVWR